MFTILRIVKLKKMSNIQGANAHNKRTENAPNADKSKTKDNVHCRTNNASKAVQSLLEKYDIKPRKNAVLANEYLLSASPDFFKEKTKLEIESWAEDNLNFLREKHREGLISFDLHLDESTPHIHAIICPIYENKNGIKKLSASEFFDRDKLRLLQTEYAEAMKNHGLERGIENSRAKHKDIKTFYSELENEVKKGAKNAKDSIKEFKEFDKKEPSFFSKKGFIIEAKKLVKKLTIQIIKLEKLNAALKNKFEHKIEQLQGQMQNYKESHEKLELLYEEQGLSKDDTERFSVLLARVQDDKKKRVEDDLKQSNDAGSYVFNTAHKSAVEMPTSFKTTKLFLQKKDLNNDDDLCS